MQKQEINFYLALQSTYQEIQLALFKGNKKIHQVNISKFEATAELMPQLSHILDSKNIGLSDLDFICANLGPAPFTTLRTSITAINGLAFVKKIPLIGVNGIEALAREYAHKNEITIAILNAFSNSLYFAIKDSNRISYGWQEADQFLAEIKHKFNHQPVKIIGLGIETFKAQLAQLPENFTLDPSKEFVSLDEIAKSGLEKFKQNEFCYSLQPLYLKAAI